MKKVLLISYYWPPSGGAGVQRWLKLSKYLALSQVEIHVLTVDPKKASYTSIDLSLEKDIDNNVTVHTSDSFEIINYYSKLVGKKNVPTAGFSNVNNKSILQKTVNAIRSNFFIPDPRVGWKKFAILKAKEIIDQYSIDTIITSSPPHSTQLIGMELKKLRAIKWIVDFRDPWTDIYYYNLLGHSSISKKIDKRLEKDVIEQSDLIITVSSGFKDIFLTKSKQISPDKIKIIPNGYDPDDFNISLVKKVDKQVFKVCYTGTMSSQYDPFIFFEALNRCDKTALTIILQIVGNVSDEIVTFLKTMDFEVEFISTVPHSEVSQFQKSADTLLLVIPNTSLANGITPGKLFEYIASGNQTIAIGPLKSDVNRILQQCNAGHTFERENSLNDITNHVEKLIELKINNKLPVTNQIELQSYSRKNQATQIEKLL